MLSPSTPFEISSTQQVALGHRYAQDSTNRVWFYSEAGASTLDRGKLAVAATVDAQRINLSFSVAPAIGDTEVSVTIGSGNAAANDFRDGYLVVQDGLGEGRFYPIEGHGAITASTVGKIKLREAIDTVSAITVANVDLLKNKYKDLVISVADQADPVAGFPNVSITADYFGWTQTWGPCSVWFDEAVVAGAALTIGTGTVGQVEMLDAAGEPLLGHVGMNAGVDTEYQLVNLCITR